MLKTLAAIVLVTSTKRQGDILPAVCRWLLRHMIVEKQHKDHHIQMISNLPLLSPIQHTFYPPHLHNVKLVHNDIICIRPLQFNILFLGPDWPYFSRHLLLVLRSEVNFWACGVSIFEKSSTIDLGCDQLIDWFSFTSLPTGPIQS